MCVFFPVTARTKQGLGGKGEFVARWETQPAPSCSASPVPTPRTPQAGRSLPRRGWQSLCVPRGGTLDASALHGQPAPRWSPFDTDPQEPTPPFRLLWSVF